MNHFNKLFLCFIISLFHFPISSSFAQAPGCPNINAGQDQNLNCNACTTLTATVLQTGLTTAYSVSSVPYAPPASFSGGTAVIVNDDDIWSQIINLPFNFCFYGNMYNKAVIGANGLISFDISLANQYCEWSFTASIPSSTLYGNCIMGAYHDIDPRYGGTINYYILGTAPCRMFVVNYNNIPHYDCNCSIPSPFGECKITTQQIVIYETTNVVEVYIQSKQTCTGWNDGNAVIGIQNTGGTAGVTPPGRNTGPWTASNEAWRFTPNGSPNYTVNWYNQTNNSLVGTGLTANVCPTGTTNYVAEAVYSSCDGTTVIKKDTVTVTMPGGFTANSSQTNPSCNVCNGTVSITTVGGVTPFVFNIGSGNQLNGNFSGLCSGNYNITVTDGSGCAGVVPVSLASPAAVALTPSQTNVSCSGDSTGSASVTISGGTSPFTYSWSTLSGLQALTGLAAGNYSVTVTDGASCTATQTFNITQPTVLNLIPSQTNVTCNSASDGAASVSVSGGVTPYSYLWNTGVQTQNLASLQAGTYSVTVTDSNNCTFEQTFNITQTTPLFVTASQTNVLCNGNSTGSANVDVSGGIPPYTYLWNNGVQTQNVASLQTGNYSVTITDGNNCSEIQTFNIAEPPALSLSIVANDATCNDSCNGTATANTSGGVIPYNYQWSDGQSASTATGLCTGNYSLLIVDSNNCMVTDNFPISEPTAFSITDTSTNSNCGQNDGSASVSISGATSPYSYLWNNGVQTQNVASLQTGNYCVTVTDANNCETSICIFVIDNPPPYVVAAATAITCNGDSNGTANASAGGGNPPGTSFVFLWNNGAQTQNISNLQAGTYSVTVTDEKNCTATDAAIIIDPPALSINSEVDTQICIGTSATLSAIAMGGTGALSFLWNNGETIYNPAVSPNANTCYTVFVTDANNCTSPTDTQCVNFFPPVDVSAVVFPPEICNGDAIDLDASVTGGKGQPYKYIWKDANGNVIDTVKQFQHIPAEEPNAATYFVIGSDQCSPQDTAFVTVSFFQNPIAGFLTDDTSGCAPLEVRFINQSSPFTNIENAYWNFGDGYPVINDTNLLVSHSYENAGTYAVQLIVVSTDGNNCRDTALRTNYIRANPVPVANFDARPQPTNVQNMLIQFSDFSLGNGNNIESWQWLFYDNNNATLLGTDSVQNPEFNFSPVNNLPDWWFIYFLEDTGDYPVKLIVTSENNCSDTIERNIHIDGIFYMNIANAFTPNDDGLNDYFFPIGVGILPEQNFTFYVFDRWGDVLFKSTNLNKPWDGKNSKGKLVPEGVYVWRLDLDNVEETHKKIMGRVTVLRN